MTLSTAEWHQRYLQQAKWTQNLRTYLYHKANLQNCSRILDVGCGTGVLDQELVDYTTAISFGVDISNIPLRYAHEYASKSIYTQADGLFLPFAERRFNVTYCHFLLLWLKHPGQAVEEMVRVTRENGFILALAEPDYGGRIDYPPDLSKIGAWQSEALKQQGANPYMGREWFSESSDRDNNIEWEVIRSDMHGNIEFRKQADQLEALDQEARKNNSRILFVPTFYAIGTVKS
jgi:ubiquinone/menaquinone biosynthesis C-methylase UbiE